MTKVQFNILNIIKEKQKEELKSYLEQCGKVEVLSKSAQFLDKRAYITIDVNGNLKRKKGNLILPIFAFLNDPSLLVEEIFKSSDLKERQNFDKINRFSNLDIEKIKFNFIKTLFNGNIEFSKKYGKELFLRDRDEFFKVISNFALIGNCNNMKPLMILAFKKLIVEYNEEIFHLFISYMVKQRDNFDIYEISSEAELELKELEALLKQKTNLLNSLEGLGLISSLKLIENIEVDNKKKVLNKIKCEINNIKEYTPLTTTEKNLLEIFL